MLLFDQNLSPRLVKCLEDCFQGAVHVYELGLAEAADTTIWTCAIEHRLAIVTKDGDFRQRSFLEGHPPKVIWVALGNCSTDAIESLLRRRKSAIDLFLSDDQASS